MKGFKINSTDMLSAFRELKARFSNHSLHHARGKLLLFTRHMKQWGAPSNKDQMIIGFVTVLI